MFLCDFKRHLHLSPDERLSKGFDKKEVGLNGDLRHYAAGILSGDSAQIGLSFTEVDHAYASERHHHGDGNPDELMVELQRLDHITAVQERRPWRPEPSFLRP
ncbi:MAG: hypothetical protein HY049_09145 [Acidobacteria bacterium]|nr:hypothetical protein [Acidobacteriota bacterium]